MAFNGPPQAPKGQLRAFVYGADSLFSLFGDTLVLPYTLYTQRQHGDLPIKP